MRSNSAGCYCITRSPPRRPRPSIPPGTGSAARSLALVPKWDYALLMRVIALSTLKKFWDDHPACADAREPTLAWYRVVYIRFIGTHAQYDAVDVAKV